MRLLMIGISHQTASVELREKLALSGDALGAALDGLGQRFPETERAIVSTCNRVELYVARPALQQPDGDALRAFLAEQCGVPAGDLTAAAVQRENEQAVSHLFRVAAGIESMVLGEPQILGQIKQAYELASQRNAVGAVLHKMFQEAIAVARRVRRETTIGHGRASVGSVAVDAARQVFDHFDDKTIVCIGAGEIAKLTLRHLLALSPAKLWLANRTPARAHALAAQLALDESRGGVRPLDDMDALLTEADIIVTSTGSPQPIITAERFRPLLRRRRFRPLFIIDIAVPRDVETAVASLNNVYLYNIDDLQQVVSHTLASRSAVIEQCEAILHEAVARCWGQVQHRDVGRLIRALRQHLNAIADAERDRTLRKLAAADPDKLPAMLDEATAELTHRLINKILHEPLSKLNQEGGDAPLGFYAAALRGLFALEEGEEAGEDDRATAAHIDQHLDKAPRESTAKS